MRKTVEIDLVKGQGDLGYALYLNETRVAGSKPYGGGTIVKSWKVGMESLLFDLGVLQEIQRLRKIAAAYKFQNACGDCRYDSCVLTSCASFEARREAVRKADEAMKELKL